MALQTFTFQEFIALTPKQLKELENITIIGWLPRAQNFYQDNHALPEAKKEEMVQQFSKNISECEALREIELVNFEEKFHFNDEIFTLFTQTRISNILDAITSLRNLKKIHLNQIEFHPQNHEKFCNMFKNLKNLKEITLKCTKNKEKTLFFKPLNENQITLWGDSIKHCETIKLEFPCELNLSQSIALGNALKHCENLALVLQDSSIEFQKNFSSFINLLTPIDSLKSFSLSFAGIGILEKDQHQALSEILSKNLQKCQELSFVCCLLEKISAENSEFFFDMLNNLKNLRSLDLSHNDIRKFLIPTSLNQESFDAFQHQLDLKN